MNLHKRTPLLAAVLAGIAFSRAAIAGPYSDDLTRCLVASTTAEDKSVVVRWIFATLALHPDAAPLSKVDAAQRAEFNSRAARVFERIVTDQCKPQTQAAMRNEGPAALQTSFKSFGETAARELLANPSVAQGLSSAAASLDPIKLMSILQ